MKGTWCGIFYMFGLFLSGKCKAWLLGAQPELRG